MVPRHVVIALGLGICVLRLSCCLAEEAAAQDKSPRIPQEDFYERAVALRSKRPPPTWAEQQKAAELLVAATGFRSREHGRSYPFNGTLPCGSETTGSTSGSCTEVEDSVTLQAHSGNGGSFNLSRSAHRGAVRELAKAFQDGSGVPQDMRLALALFRSASDAGDPEAQGQMALRYSVGLDEPECWSADNIVGFVEPKPGMAVLYYYFGALGGDMASRMALGYRHLTGLWVPKACWTAVSYYQPVAEQVSDLAAGTAFAPAWSPSTSSLAPSSAGPAAPGAPTAAAAEGGSGGDSTTTSTTGSAGSAGNAGGPAASSGAAPGSGAAGPNIRTGGGGKGGGPTGALPHIERIRLHLQAAQGGLRSDRHKEVVQYYQYSADRGNTEAQTAVGQVLNYGTHGIDRDHGAALSYFKLAAEAGDVDAMAHLGSMYANGYGTAQSYATALEWWQRAAKRHNGVALFGLGYLYLTGRAVEQDHDRAFQYFTKAAEQVHSDARPDALFYLAVMHMRGMGVRRKSVQRALNYFTLAAQMGHPLAQYNAAVMNLAGKGTTRNCKPAVALLKLLAEKGPEAASVQLGHEHFFRGRYGLALLSYLRAADIGLELGQSNAAWMLERGYVQGRNASALSFALYKQSAAQANVHSLLCMGDAYFYGRGVQQDWVRSAALYYEAFQERSAEAMFNLGFMHEFGVGVPKDLELARRFYNMARHTQPDAALPVVLANIWLRLHGWWDALRPHLPSALDPVWNAVFTLHPPHTSLFGPWVARAQRLLPNLALIHAEASFWRWVDLAGLSSLGSLLGAGVRLEDASEGATLLALLGGLALVVRLRRRRAQARMAQQQEAARLLERQLQRELEERVAQEQGHGQAGQSQAATAAAGPGQEVGLRHRGQVQADRPERLLRPEPGPAEARAAAAAAASQRAATNGTATAGVVEAAAPAPAETAAAEAPAASGDSVADDKGSVGSRAVESRGGEAVSSAAAGPAPEGAAASGQRDGEGGSTMAGEAPQQELQGGAPQGAVAQLEKVHSEPEPSSGATESGQGSEQQPAAE